MTDDEKQQVYVLERRRKDGAGLGIVGVYENYNDAWDDAQELDDDTRVWNKPLLGGTQID